MVAPTFEEYLPGTHKLQSERKDPPTVSKYFPTGHETQSEVVILLVNVPAGQSEWQVAAFAAERSPGLQDVHVSDPSVAYVPAEHWTQAAAEAAPTAADEVPGGQRVHADTDTAPTASE